MTRAARLLLLFAGLVLGACGGGDPGDGSSAAQVTNEDAGEGMPEAEAFAPVLLADSSVPPASDAASDAPPVSLSAGDGGCQLPDLLCAESEDGGGGGLRCIDVTSDPLNCGGCGHACGGPSAACIGGSCACSELGFLYCPAVGACVDTTSDVNNCGACGYVCDPSQFNACASGLCVMN